MKHRSQLGYIHKYIFATIIALLFTSTVQLAGDGFRFEVPSNLQNNAQAIMKENRRAEEKKQNVSQDTFKSNTGKQYLQLASEAQDDAEAARFYDKACQGGSAKGCYIFASMMKESRGVEKDSRELPKVYRRAARLYGKDCDGGDGEGCMQLAKMLLDRRVSILDETPKEVAIFYRKACDRGNAEGCSKLGVNFFNGDGVEKNVYEAARFARKACNLSNSWGCSALGYFYTIGSGVPQNLYMAAKLYKKACYSNRGTPARCDTYRRLKNRGY